LVSVGDLDLSGEVRVTLVIKEHREGAALWEKPTDASDPRR
jgi:hypothetical protein